MTNTHILVRPSRRLVALLALALVAAGAAASGLTGAIELPTDDSPITVESRKAGKGQQEYL